jgi:hypothetical protein
MWKLVNWLFEFQVILLYCIKVLDRVHIYLDCLTTEDGTDKLSWNVGK